MGNIRDQLCFHALAFHFLIYRFFKSGADLCELLLKWFKHPDILGDHRVKIPLRDALHASH